MRILAVDLGTRRVGLAICSPEETLVVGAGVLERTKGDDPVPAVAAAAREREVERVVVGLPLNMDGTEGPRAKKTREFGERVGAYLGLPVEFWDERLTTVEADRILRDSKVNWRKRKGLVDEVAATVILRDYLAARR
jgi:putative Holliday junction resolvase